MLKRFLPKNKRCASAVQMIAGANGPTSLFFARKGKRQNKRIKNRQNKIIDKLSANPHSLSQLVDYIIKKYDATKVDEKEKQYKLAFQCVKSQFVLNYKPELISIPMPEASFDFGNEEKILEYFRQVELRYQEAENINDNEIEIKFEQYKIEVNEPKRKGTIQIDIEYNYENLAISFFNKGKSENFGKIERDIYEYYGVSEQDIANRTDRLMLLVRIIEETGSRFRAIK